MCGPFMRIASLCFAVLCLTAATHTTASAQWGTLKGRFVYDGKAPTPEKIDTSKEPMCGKHNVVDESLVVGEDGGLANVVLYVSSKDVKVHPDYEKTAKDTVRFDNKHCRFEPHVLAMRVSQTLELHNSDSFSHNSNLAPIRDEPINPLLGPDATIEYKFQMPQKLLVPVSCNIHGWMKGHVVVRDDPYAAVS
ncbi:MAG TPA: hypothetical protein VGX76_11760, partial [Pirellulales bacterium]|nr:hypothetical protein [Pirellulales bacterium]